MIYISTAMYYEAKPFIENMGLKKDMDCKKFDVFMNDKVVLIITGVGIESAAIGTTYMLTRYIKNETNLFLNVGVCGAKNINDYSIGDIVFVNKVINHNKKIRFYPDMVYRHPFKEGILESYSKVVDYSLRNCIKGDIVDMEGAGAFEAASIFIPLHNIFFIKIVCDFLDTSNINSNVIKTLLNKNNEKIVSYINQIYSNVNEEKILDNNEICYIEEIKKNLKISKAMQIELLTLSEKYKVRGRNLKIILESYKKYTVKNKKQGKGYFNELTQKLMEF